MPPRRSTRNSLPTPAQSNKAESSASTSPPAKIAGGANNIKVEGGLITPASMSSGTFGDGQEVKLDDGYLPVGDWPMTTGLQTVATGSKRKQMDEFDFVQTEMKAEGMETAARTTRRVIDSVVVPSRKSKLSTEKTDSLENLTLDNGLKAESGGVKGEDDAKFNDPLALASEDERLNSSTAGTNHEPEKTARRALSRAKDNGGRPSHQPFNVGKHSTIRKESATGLELDSDDSAFSDSPEPVKSAKGKGKGKAKAKAAPKGRKRARSATESEFSEPADDDFAMDSDEEEKQLAKAFQASVKQETDVKGSSSGRGKAARGRGRGKAVGQAVGGRKNTLALRAAAARAAESRLNGGPGADTPVSMDSDSTVPPFGDASPLPGPSSRNTPRASRASGASTPFAELDFSDDSEEDSDFSSDLSDDSAPKPKGKGRAGKRVGAGRRLDTGDVDLGSLDPGILDDMDVETRHMTIQKMKDQRRKARKAEEAEMEPIKKEEKRLKKELGRKLTNGERNLIRLKKHHPELADVWGDLKENIVPVKPVPMEAHPSLKLTLLPFQKESLYWMKKQEEGQWKGGMLADEMGMGKTIQTIALLLSEPRRKPSLVVAPVVALMQWKHEIETHATGFKVCLWHGQGRMKAAELKKFDVVLSSYGTLEAAFRRQQRGFKRGEHFIKEKSPMHEFQWFRVILDEAHNIKERSTNAAKAAFALDAQYKWCLSGTPLQNRVGELYSLVRFLGADPFSHYFCKKCDCKSLHWAFKDRRHCDQCGHTPMNHVCFWNTEILTPIAKYGIEQGNPGHTAFKKLKILLDRMMLRRTKLERADDLGLPPRTIVVRRDYFSPAEKELYMSLFSDAKRTFATYVDSGTVLNNYSNIFSLITRMRQMACHPDLVLRSKTSVLVQNQAAGTVCRLCNDQAEDAIISQCKHLFDRECIRQYLDIQSARGKAPECPVCHIEISIDLEAEAVDMDEQADKRVGKAKQGILSRLNLDNWRSSSKLEALVEELEKLRNKDCTTKSLVFSQFVSFLDLIAFRLQRAGFNICRLEGGMTPQQRDATIQHFMKNSEVTVFLISLKAGGVALNLTEASMVFMMDSWWNPSVEYQAMDRIHRLGQKRPVKVVKLVVEDSIEDQIVQLQAKKLAMTEAALSTDPDSALGKLTVEDLGFLFKM